VLFLTLVSCTSYPGHFCLWIWGRERGFQLRFWSYLYLTLLLVFVVLGTCEIFVLALLFVAFGKHLHGQLNVQLEVLFKHDKVYAGWTMLTRVHSGARGKLVDCLLCMYKSKRKRKGES
jgi:hypothetical protein